MVIKKFNKFILEDNNSDMYLKMYAFDWDDNILNMPTVIHMEKREGNSWVHKLVSTSDFSEIRSDKINWRFYKNDPNEAFSEFRDFGPRGDKAFLEDTIVSIKNKKFGPSWVDFIECLENGSLFAIITARGHESSSIRVSVEWIIDNYLDRDQIFNMYNNLRKYSYLLDEGDFERILKGTPSKNDLIKSYLDKCDFVGISSPSRKGNISSPEKAKEEALISFKHKVNNFASRIGYKVMIGFSDDDLGNIKHMEDLIDNINHEEFPNIIYYVIKGTKNPNKITKKILSLTETSNQAPGLESSVLAFTQFGNMTGKLYPKGPEDRQDDYKNQIVRQTKYLSKTSKDIIGTRKRKKKKKL